MPLVEDRHSRAFYEAQLCTARFNPNSFGYREFIRSLTHLPPSDALPPLPLVDPEDATVMLEAFEDLRFE